MRIVLFALTGIGNEVLKTLICINATPLLVVTREEKGAFPHYRLPQLVDEAKSAGVKVMFGVDGEIEASKLYPDIIICATYHRLLNQDLIGAAKLSFNIHPSLLPAYPGRNPFYWQLVNGEKISGVTAHKLTDRFDEGEIFRQKILYIRGNETQGTLRKRISKLSGELVREIINEYPKIEYKKISVATNFYPGQGRQVMISDRFIYPHENFKEVDKKIRALTPWPGAILSKTQFKIIKVLRIKHRNLRSTMPGGYKFFRSNLAWCKIKDALILILLKN